MRYYIYLFFIFTNIIGVFNIQAMNENDSSGIPEKVFDALLEKMYNAPAPMNHQNTINNGSDLTNIVSDSENIVSNSRNILSNVANGVWGSCTIANVGQIIGIGVGLYQLYQFLHTPSKTMTDDSLQQKYKMLDLVDRGILIEDSLRKQLMSCEKTEHKQIEQCKIKIDKAQQETITFQDNMLKYQQVMQRKFCAQEIEELEKRIKNEQNPDLKKQLQEILLKKKQDSLKLYND